jgi:ComF family protein
MLLARTSELSAEASAESSATVAAVTGFHLAGIGRALVSLLLPPLCLGCETVIGSEERWLCTDCRRRLSESARPRTRAIGLGAPAAEASACQDETGACDDEVGAGRDETCDSAAGSLELTVSYALDYSCTVSKLITELKYGDKPGLAGLLAPLMNSALTGPIAEDTVMIPVPVHASRRRERGYNQSELLAERIARMRGLSLERGVLVKTRNTGSQTGLERGQRMVNVADSFGVRSPDRLTGRRVLLVDDVVTTGSTLRECARAVLESGAVEVSACAAASSL